MPISFLVLVSIKMDGETSCNVMHLQCIVDPNAWLCSERSTKENYMYVYKSVSKDLMQLKGMLAACHLKVPHSPIHDDIVK